MTPLKTALLKLKTEASERRDALALTNMREYHVAEEKTAGAIFDPTFSGFCYGYDSRQKEIDALISAIEKQAEALEKLGLSCINAGMYGPMKISPGKCTCSTCSARQTQSEVLALLSGLEEKV